MANTNWMVPGTPCWILISEDKNKWKKVEFDFKKSNGDMIKK